MKIGQILSYAVLAIVLSALLFYAPELAAFVAVCIIAFLFYRNTQALKESEERWKFAIEGTGDGVWDWHVPTDTVVYSARYKEIHGFDESDIKQNTEAWQNRIHPDDRERVKQEVHACLEGRTSQYSNEHRICCKDGSIKWVLARGMVVHRDEQGKPIRMIGTHSDITARKDMEERIRQMAHFDALTHLPNRSLFSDRLHQALLQARRERAGVAVMFIDLDGFKPVNDTYGHNMGDLLLQEIAKRLTGLIRTSDTVARIGGDEFVVLLSSVEHEDAAAVVATKILQALNTPFIIEQITLNISASIGVALYPDHAHDEKRLLINADLAMYYTKQNGGHNFTFYSDQLEPSSHSS